MICGKPMDSAETRFCNRFKGHDGDCSSDLAKIAVTVLARITPDSFVGIENDLGRLLPSGKWTGAANFRDTAASAFREQTGMEVVGLYLLFQGMANNGYYVYVFLGNVVGEIAFTKTAAGVGVPVSFKELKESFYASSYELLEEAYDRFVATQ